MLRIVLPLCTPGLLSAGIFAFTLAQNEFLYALIFLTKSDVRTVPVGAITELIRGDVFYWGQLMAAALLGSIAVALIYSFFVDYYVAGVTAGLVENEPFRPRGIAGRPGAESHGREGAPSTGP